MRETIKNRYKYIDAENKITSRCITKLGYIEDYEDSMGCDIVVTLCAIKNGIYAKDNGRIFPNTLYYDPEEWIWYLIWTNYEGVEFYYSLKDYDITWSLERDNLK